MLSDNLRAVSMHRWAGYMLTDAGIPHLALVAVGTEDAEAGWEFVFDEPLVDVSASAFSMLATTSVDVIYGKEFNVRFVAT